MKRGLDACFMQFAAAITLAVSAVATAPALAAKTDPAFTVANYPVDATDKNAVAAKEKALADGQDAAFRSLLKRLVPVTAYKQLSRAKDIRAADMISGVSVRSEQNSATQYIASLDFAFQADAVRSALQSRQIPFVEVQAPAVTIIPVARSGTPPEAKPDTGAWQNAWKGLDLEHTLTPVKLDDLKSVIHNDTVNMLMNGDDNGQRILAGEYKSELIVLAVAETDTAAKKLIVTLAGRDAVGPITLKRSYRLPDGDLAYANEFAAVVALGVLEGRWKSMKSVDVAAFAPPAAPAGEPQWSRPAGATPAGGTGAPVRFVAEFANLGQWNEIRTQLLDTPGVEDVEIATFSAVSADVGLTFPGGATALANALGARGLRLTPEGGGWTLRSTH